MVFEHLEIPVENLEGMGEMLSDLETAKAVEWSLAKG